ncbi:MAG: ankyrin repeat domain-containing protein [Planctomycetota bacterium]
MRRAVKIAIVLIPVALLIHDAASGRFRTFRGFRDERYIHCLFSAAGQDNLAEVRRLMRIVGRFETRETYGQTVLHRARSVAVAQLLLDRGAYVDAKDHAYGMTPLFYAIGPMHQDVVKLLIERGANVNAKSSEGQTPLHFAARWNSRDAAILLISKGAEVNARDTCGRTPLDLAKVEMGKKAVAVVLRKHGAKTGKELDEEARDQRPEARDQKEKDKTQDER